MDSILTQVSQEDECEIHTATGEPHIGYVSGEGFERIPITYIVDDGWAIFDGDIVLGRAEAVADASRQVAEYLHQVASGETRMLAPLGTIIRDQRRRWPGGIIPYVYEDSFPNRERVERAIRHWHEVTPVRLVPRTNQRAFVNFVSATKCSSEIGMVGDRQDIKLAGGCGWKAVVHEIGHAFGLSHEQRRPDRDRYIEIHEENIKPGAEGNFTPTSLGDPVGPYNYGSVMHYDTHTFSRNGRATITTRPPGIPIGRRGELNGGDLQAIGLLLNSPTSDTPVLGRYESTTMDTAFPGTGMTLWHFRGQHQFFVRIRGGIASLPQRCLVFMRRGLLGGEPTGEPNLSIGGAVPRPGHWFSLPPQNGDITYYVGSEYNLNGWKRASGVHVRRELHTNGFYYTLGFDDTSGHVDYNNHVVEVAVLLRQGLFEGGETKLVDVSPTEDELSRFGADEALI